MKYVSKYFPNRERMGWLYIIELLEANIPGHVLPWVAVTLDAYPGVQSAGSDPGVDVRSHDLDVAVAESFDGLLDRRVVLLAHGFAPVTGVGLCSTIANDRGLWCGYSCCESPNESKLSSSVTGLRNFMVDSSLLISNKVRWSVCIRIVPDDTTWVPILFYDLRIGSCFLKLSGLGQ